MAKQEKGIYDHCVNFYEIRKGAELNQNKIDIRYGFEPVSREIFNICESLNLENGKSLRVGVDQYMIYELMVKKQDPVCYELYLIKNEYDDGATREIPPLRLSTIQSHLVSEEMTSEGQIYADGLEKVAIIKEIVEFVKKKNDYLETTKK